MFQTSFPVEIVINKLLPLAASGGDMKFLNVRRGWQIMGESCELINRHV